MVSEAPTRKLATILALDVAGYSARTEADEQKTAAEIVALRGLIERIAGDRGGRIFNTAGDGFMLEFASSLAAVQVAFQLAESCEPKVRIGVHLGDVAVQPNGDLLGHGVNVAARLMAMSEPGDALVSAAVRQTIRDPIVERLVSRGMLQLDKMTEAIEAFAFGRTEPAALSASPSAPLQRAEPSLAVLPFTNLSDDPAQAYFVDGMMEEVATALSRIRSIFVIASASTQKYKGKPVNIQAVGRELGVRYLLDGSVRKAGNRVRIAVKLTDVTDGSQLWAERYEDTLDDVFALQDRVALSVAGVIEPTVQDVELRRAARRPTSSADAYDLFLKAVALVDAYEKNAMFSAIELIEAALALDPNFARALSVAGYAHAQIVVSGWASDLAPHRELAMAYAGSAVRLAPDDAESLSWNATTYMALDADYPLARVLLDRSLQINPGSYLAWMMSAWLRAAEGESEVAVEHMQMSMQLNPSSSDRGHQLSGMALARFGQRRFDEAVRLLKEAIPLQPSVSFNLALLAACQGHLGSERLAAEALERYGQVSTIEVDKRVSLFRRGDLRDLFLEGVSLARSGARKQ